MGASLGGEEGKPIKWPLSPTEGFSLPPGGWSSGLFGEGVTSNLTRTHSAESRMSQERDGTQSPLPSQRKSSVTPRNPRRKRYMVAVLFVACVIGGLGYLAYAITSAEQVAPGSSVGGPGEPDPPPPPPPPPPRTYENTTACAPPQDGPVTVQMGLVGLESTGKNQVCLLMKDGKTVLGRSYDGSDWETGAAGTLGMECSQGICEAYLQEEGVYTLHSYEVTDKTTRQEEVARFLTQATFGPKKSEILGLKGSFKDWITAQIKLPPTLHRAHLRARAHPRAASPTYVGKPRDACKRGSRWMRSAFSTRDIGKQATLKRVGGRLVITLEGVVRTRLPESWTPALGSSPFKICRVRNVPGALVAVAKNCNGKQLNMKNDFLDLLDSQIAGNRKLNLVKGAELVEMVSKANGIKVLRFTSLRVPSCSEPGGGPFFLRDRDGKLYQHDRRLELLENTIDSPASGYNMKYCPNAPKTFQNVHGCVIGGQGCRRGNNNNIAVQDDLVERCGSPGEVANVPELGSRYHFAQRSQPEIQFSDDNEVDFRLIVHSKVAAIWMTSVVYAPDQLRQRVAFALSQILVVTKTQVPGFEGEMYAVYYDIFVRHAFGKYVDVMREVTYSPLMAQMLTYEDNRSVQNNLDRYRRLVFPDENYAREIMQLFSIGLYKLDMDGTPQRNSNGILQKAYSNEDIMAFSRIFTGFRRQNQRANTENKKPTGSQNKIDPLRLDPQIRDLFPKMNLYGGYIGDGYPLCSDLPSKMFLRKGALYSYIGSRPLPEIIEEDPSIFTRPDTTRVVLRPASKLYQELCRFSGGKCRYKSQVVLPRNLPCDGKECGIESARVVQVGRAFYEFVRPACVEFPFFNNGVKIWDHRQRNAMCVDRKSIIASPACCTNNAAVQDCAYHGERVSFAVAQARCQKIKKPLCNHRSVSTRCGNFGNFFTNQNCPVLLKVREDGQIGIMHRPIGGRTRNYLQNGNPNFFRVTWESPVPTIQNNCAGVCTRMGELCSCNVNVVESTVFTKMPSSRDALDKLHIGSLPPDVYRSYKLVRNVGGVKLYATDASKPFVATSIFEVQEFGKPKFLRNKLSTVFAKGKKLFRNPVSFMNLVEGTVRDSRYEVDALLDHLSYHPNTAPFLAYRMIQRFVTSNPSPRYIEAVAKGFVAGKYDGVGSGEYGDMGAMIAAVLLDKEARNTVLDYDPSHGGLREPKLKLLHFFRSMEVKSQNNMEFAPNELESKIGQQAMVAPNVFNFFRPEYSPPGVLSDAKLVGPEAQIFTTPKVISYMNGMISAAKYDLSNCDEGFFFNFRPHSCNGLKTSNNNNQIRNGAIATLDWIPPGGLGGTTAAKVVDDLDLLLTGGRLENKARNIIIQQYNVQKSRRGAAAAKRLAQELMVATPEFQVSNRVQRAIGEKRPTKPKKKPGKPYKAIVYLYVSGGLDSYNLLVPHSNCKGKDMFQEYSNVRADVALPKGQLLPIDVPEKNQVCNTFGLHPEVGAVQKAYNVGDALFLANAGVLAEPLTKQDLLQGKKKLPDALFAHNIQTQSAQTLTPMSRDTIGVLGRAQDILWEDGYSAGSFSINDKNYILQPEGEISPPASILSGNGVSDFNRGELGADVKRINEAIIELSRDVSGSMFAETWGGILENAMNETFTLSDFLKRVNVRPFKSNAGLSKQFYQVAKLIKARNLLGHDRQAFFVQIHGLDTHNNNQQVVQSKLREINAAIDSFVAEMRAQNIWNSVTIVQASEFGRTITSNGGGTDHGWGGHYMVLGGGIKGKRILGEYPDDLTSSGKLNVGRGRFLPVVSWEAVWNGVLEWYGVPQNKLSRAIPLRDAFTSNLLKRNDLYN